MSIKKYHYQSIDSTQEESKRLIKSGKISTPCYIIADEQSHGKGRYSRSWDSPAGAGIYLSIVQKLSATELDLNQFAESYTLQVAQLVIESLDETLYESSKQSTEEITGSEFYIKPINDIYFNGCKLAGILVEIYSGYIITGIGINTRKTTRNIEASKPDDAPVTPISLEEILPNQVYKNMDIEVLIDKICQNIIHNSKPQSLIS